MNTPKRVQRKRSRGWKMPEGAVYVGRGTKWGNKYRLSDGWSREEAIQKFRADLFAGRLPCSIEQVQRHLRGKDLACWCRLEDACHADVLLEVANA